VDVVGIAKTTTATKEKQQKKDIVAAVIKLETAKTATTERQQEKELVAAVFRLAITAKGRLQEK